MNPSDPQAPTDPADPPRVQDAAARALDFRGDVTIELLEGRTIVGYVFDATLQPPAVASVRVLHHDSDIRERIALASIRSIELTGKDAALGRSWETWIRQYAARRSASESESTELGSE